MNRGLVVTALALLSPALFAQVNGFTPAEGYHAVPLYLTGSVLAVSPSGKVAVGVGSFGGGGRIDVYDRIDPNGRTLLHSLVRDEYRFFGGIAWRDDSTLVFTENGDLDTAFSWTPGNPPPVELSPVGSIPDAGEIALINGAPIVFANGGPGTNRVYGIASGSAFDLTGAFGVGYGGGMALFGGEVFLGDTADPNFSGLPGQVWRAQPRYTNGDLTGMDLIDAASLAGGLGSGCAGLATDPHGAIYASSGATLTRLLGGSAMPFGVFDGAFPFPTGLTFVGSRFLPFDGDGLLIVNGEFTGAGGYFAIAPVPEPTSLAALGAGLLALLRRRRTLAVCAIAGLTALAAANDPTPRDFAARVVDYNGINGVSGYQNPTAAIGLPSAAATPFVPDNSSVVSFGWGGYLTLGFDRPIFNIPPGIDQANPYGFDFIVFGNAFYVGNECRAWAEPAYVEAGVDLDGDGQPDEWFLLLPQRPEFNIPLQNIYFGSVGVCPDSFVGYADCTPTDGRGNPLVPDDPWQPGLQAPSAGGDAFDLSWAVDRTTLLPVELTVAHFVRIVHAGNASFGPLGNSSTEIDAVAILRPLGDVTGDGCVDDNDLAVVLASFGGSGPGDANHDGLIDDVDLAIVLERFGAGC
ncbi:MAG: PEP-CTERM sorting domain-containing protein [Armatimonadetes bacterium]|nr:PEP-CTERM sorting domain-containing protein [Armatimonadota bacterium]